MNNDFVVYVEQDEDGRFIGTIPSISSCYAEGETQEEMMKNLKEVITLCLRNEEQETVSVTQFVGIQTFSLFPHAKTHSNSSKKTYKDVTETRI